MLTLEGPVANGQVEAAPAWMSMKSMALTLTLACSGMMGKSRWKRLGKPQLWITFDLLDSICSVAFSTRQDSVLLMVLYLIFTAPIGATKISHIFLRKKGDL